MRMFVCQVILVPCLLQFLPFQKSHNNVCLKATRTPSAQLFVTSCSPLCEHVWVRACVCTNVHRHDWLKHSGVDGTKTFTHADMELHIRLPRHRAELGDPSKSLQGTWLPHAWHGKVVPRGEGMSELLKSLQCVPTISWHVNAYIRMHANVHMDIHIRPYACTHMLSCSHKYTYSVCVCVYVSVCVLAHGHGATCTLFSYSM